LDLYVLSADNDFLLLGGFEVPGCIRLLPHFLDFAHHVLLLRQKSLAQFGRPIHMLVHHAEHLRKRNQRLDTQVPVHFVQSRIKLVSF
jgi:hypothetical protein